MSSESGDMKVISNFTRIIEIIFNRFERQAGESNIGVSVYARVFSTKWKPIDSQPGNVH